MPSRLDATRRGSPRRYLASRWPWAALAWCLQAVLAGSLVAGAVAALTATVLAGGLPSGGLVVAVSALLLLVVAVVLLVGRWQRSAVQLVGAARIPSAYPPGAGPALAWWPRVRARLRGFGLGTAVLRDLGYALAMAVHAALCLAALLLAAAALVVVGFSVAVLLGAPAELRPRVDDVDIVVPSLVAGPLLLLATPYLLGWLASTGVRLARVVLAPSPDAVRGQLAEVLASRRRLTDAFDLERRRIERDLHDGAQQRIVAQSITLGSAAVELAALGEPAQDALALVQQAREANRQILAELRDLVRGIHPQVLTDHGLAAALAEVTSRHPTPVDLRVDVPGRLPELVESTAYFVLLEALTNTARHAGATTVSLACRLRGDRLYVRAQDDGRGGAVLRPGGGLTGLVERVAALDGLLTVTSPVGGPTVVAAVLPGGPGRPPGGAW